MTMLPEPGLSKPDMRFSSVDFPEPEGHMIAINSQAFTSRDMSLNICIFHSGLLYAFEICCSEIIVI
jgi:hypothetical protein